MLFALLSRGGAGWIDIIKGGAIMYGVHITFDDGHEPVTRFHMNRRQYSEEMRKWQMQYDLEVEKVDEFTTGDHLIFTNAYERTTQRMLKNIERVKSRARYYSRENGRAGKSRRTGSNIEG